MKNFPIKIFLISFFLQTYTTPSSLACSHRYAAVVIDDRTGKIIHAENAHHLRHPASLTKKMTLYLLFEALQKQKITLKTQFSTSALASRQIPSKLGLQPGDKISVQDIIKGLVTKSANDAAVIAAEGLSGSLKNFVVLMNKTAKKLGMQNTRFYNASGVPDARQVSTAMDMATLGRALYHHFPMHYKYFQTKHFCYKGHSHRNHNHMLGEFPGLDGLKTGFTNASGFNISTSALRYDHHGKPVRLFAVVMGGQSWKSRDQRAAFLLESGFRKIGAFNRHRSRVVSFHSKLKKRPSTKEFDHNHMLNTSLQQILSPHQGALRKENSSLPHIIHPIGDKNPAPINFSKKEEKPLSRPSLPTGWVNPSKAYLKEKSPQ